MQSVYHQNNEYLESICVNPNCCPPLKCWNVQTKKQVLLSSILHWMRLILIQLMLAVLGRGTSSSHTKTVCIWYLWMFSIFCLIIATQVATRNTGAGNITTARSCCYVSSLSFHNSAMGLCCPLQEALEFDSTWMLWLISWASWKVYMQDTVSFLTAVWSFRQHVMEW